MDHYCAIRTALFARIMEYKDIQADIYGNWGYNTYREYVDAYEAVCREMGVNPSLY